MSAPLNTILVGDARWRLTEITPASVDMVLTSPPYFRLRDYAATDQIGLETTVDEWTDRLVAVLNQTAPLLVPTGSLWLNLGDSYATHPRQGAGRKSLLLAPERLALRLTADGWILRNKIVWQKANPMPTSVPDRLACTWEVVYVFARQRRYFFDLDGIRVPHTSQLSKPQRTAPTHSQDWRGPNSGSTTGFAKLKAAGLVGHPLGKNPGDVWRLAASSFRGGHHATFPLALAERAILAGAPEARCRTCRAPWRRPVLRAIGGTAVRGALNPSCSCATPLSEPAMVLDPFMGAGTTAVAAQTLGRDWLGVEINPDFARIAQERINAAPVAARQAA